jgi:hypothetical protein
VAVIPACLQHLRSNGVRFHRLRARECVLDVVLARRRHDPCAIRDTSLDLRENRPQIEENVEKWTKAYPRSKFAGVNSPRDARPLPSR